MPPPDSTPPRLLVLATGNPGKAREFADLLAGLPIELKTLSEFSGLIEPTETGTTLAENARLKAAYYAQATGHWALADDTGLFVDALHGAPGLHTARYAGPQATAADNRAKLLSELAAAPLDERSARFVCALALADPRGRIVLECEGTCHGRIRASESGAGGFGYDPLFEIVEYHRTFAELGAAAKNRLSHRARAAERLRAAVLTLW